MCTKKRVIELAREFAEIHMGDGDELGVMARELAALIGFDLDETPLGLYRIHWVSGGTSLAAIGQTRDGGRWIAPTNWFSAIDPSHATYRKHCDAILRLEPLRIEGNAEGGDDE